MTLKDLQDLLKIKFKKIILKSSIELDELTLSVNRDSILDALSYLRDNNDLAFKQLVDLCGVDYPNRADRFDVVYHLLSHRHNYRIRVKISTDTETPVPTASNLFRAAGWYEREAFDLYGILFDNHPDLRRILTDYDFQGHPMRKDFPLTGYVEPRYDTELGRIVYDKVNLPQEFRTFDFLSPWEGMTPERLTLPGDEKATKG